MLRPSTNKTCNRISLLFNCEISMARRVAVSGVEYRSLSEVARKYGFSPSKISSRLLLGWTLREALEIDPRPKANCVGREIIVNGIKYAKIKDAAKEHGFTGRFIANRINLGLTPEQALELEPFPDWFVPGKSQKRKVDAKRRRLMEVETGIKKCSTCKKEKTLDCFHGSYDNDNISSRCQDCISASFLRYRYGISVEQFNAIRKKQDGCCAICKAKLEIKKDSTFRSKKVAVDHCHATGEVRGLLCSSCNQGLGLFRDNENLLASAIEYLKASRQQSGGNLLSYASELDGGLAR